jgi:transposase-like protein
VQVNIKNLIDDAQCYQTVRELRWPDGVACPFCESAKVIKRGFDDTEPARQRYECHDCDKRFDDLTDTIFAGSYKNFHFVRPVGRKEASASGQTARLRLTLQLSLP